MYNCMYDPPLFTQHLEPIRICIERKIPWSESSKEFILYDSFLEEISIENYPYEYYLIDVDSKLLNSSVEGAEETVDLFERDVKSQTLDRIPHALTTWLADQSLLNYLRAGQSLFDFPRSQNGRFNGRENLIQVSVINGHKEMRDFNPEYAIWVRRVSRVHGIWDKNAPNPNFDPTKPVIVTTTDLNFVQVALIDKKYYSTMFFSA